MTRSSKSPRWETPRGGHGPSMRSGASGLHAGDSGIFVTCDKGQEAKCLREMDDIMSEYIATHHASSEEINETDKASQGQDIEADIEKELGSLTQPPSIKDRKKPYTFVKLEITCVSFIRMQPPLDPIKVVRDLCEEAHSNPSQRRSRYVRRLTPMTCMRKTLGNGLDQLCDTVLPPVFGEVEGGVGKKFAIRPTIRNNHQIDRDLVIKTTAEAVARMSPHHSVDLKKYDCLILVEVYRNVCGMSIVGPEFERLKRFNLSEIYQASQPPGYIVPSDPQIEARPQT